MLGVKSASLGKMGTHTLDGASHTDVTSLTEAKGDILVYTGSTWDKLAIGTNNKILIADSSTSTGLAWAEDITIGGDLTVSGDTITANVATIQVEDKNMELNKVGSPSDSNADGGGLTIKGTSDKTITFTNATGDFDFSENVDIASGKTFKVNGTTVLSNNTLGSGVTSSSLTSLGTITTGVWNGTAIGLAYGGTGLVGATDGKIVVADGSGAPVAVQAMTANDGTFKHEVGGIEADISAIAKGGIVAGSGSGSMAIRTVGSNDHVLTADSSEATGMKWAAAASGAVTALNNATANEIVTVGSTTTELDAEANLTFDGSGDLEIGAGSSGDPRITFDINSTDEWTVGVDDSDSDKFKIDTGAAVGGATKFSLDSSGNAVIAGALTLGTTSFSNSDGVLQVAGQTNITSLGTLTALTVDDIGLDSKTVTMTGSSGDTATLVVAANGAFSINTNDAAAAAAHLTVDIDGDIDLDSHSGVLKISAAGTEILNVSNSSSDVIIKPVVDEKDIIFQQRDGTEVARVEHNGTFNIVTDKLAINGTAVTSTAAELNILDGVTSTASELNILDGVTSTAAELNIMDGNATVGTTAVADGDGIVTNDNGTMQQTTVQTFATYFGSEITAMSNLVTTGTLNSGAISSGFGNIDIGSSTFDTTGAVTSGALTAGGILKTDDTTDATSTTDGSLQTDGGLSVAKDAVIGDDLKLLSDSAVLNLGAGNDVTITHDGTTGATITGTPMVYESKGSGSLANDTHSGIVLEFLAGESLAIGDWVYMSTVDGRVSKADANDTGDDGHYPAIGVAVSAQGSAGSAVKILTHGVYNDSDGFGGSDLTEGKKMFLSTTAGAVTATAPSSTSDRVQVCGVAVGPRDVFVNPSLDTIEHA